MITHDLALQYLGTTLIWAKFCFFLHRLKIVGSSPIDGRGCPTGQMRVDQIKKITFCYKYWITPHPPCRAPSPLAGRRDHLVHKGGGRCALVTGQRPFPVLAVDLLPDYC